MADLKCINFERLCAICSCDTKLLVFLRLRKVLFSFHGPCDRCSKGQINLRQDRSAPDGQIWRCSNRNCTFKLALRKHSFFSGSSSDSDDSDSSASSPVKQPDPTKRVSTKTKVTAPPARPVQEGGVNPLMPSGNIIAAKELLLLMLIEHDEVAGQSTVFDLILHF